MCRGTDCRRPTADDVKSCPSVRPPDPEPSGETGESVEPEPSDETGESVELEPSGETGESLIEIKSQRLRASQMFRLSWRVSPH